MRSYTISEYDAFGPWIYIIKNRDSIPPLFRQYEKELAGNLLAFKVPRNIERRDANPGMNLYDAVVAVFSERILILERINRNKTDTAKAGSIPMGEIDSIKHHTCLLCGVLTICTADKPVILHYNTVSDNIIRDAVNLIRSLIPQKPARKHILHQIPSIIHSLDFMEHGFVSICDRILRETSDLRLIAYQPYLYYRIPRQFSLRILMRFGLTDTIKSAFMILISKRELVVVRRTYNCRFPSPEAYAYSETIIPVDSLKQLEVSETGGSQLQLILETYQTSEELRCDRNNSSIEQILKIYRPVEAAAVQTG